MEHLLLTKDKGTKVNTDSTVLVPAGENQMPTLQPYETGNSIRLQFSHTENVIQLQPGPEDEAIQRQRRIIQQIGEKKNQVVDTNLDNDEQIFLNIISLLTDEAAKKVPLSNEEENTLKDIDNLLTMWIARNGTSEDNANQFKNLVNNTKFPAYLNYSMGAYFGSSYTLVNTYRREKFAQVKRGKQAEDSTKSQDTRRRRVKLPDYRTQPEFWPERVWKNLTTNIPKNEDDRIKLFNTLFGTLNKPVKSSVPRQRKPRTQETGEQEENQEKYPLKKNPGNALDAILGSFWDQDNELSIRYCKDKGNYLNDRLLDIKLKLAFSRAPLIPGPITVFRGTGSIVVGSEKIDEMNLKTARYTTSGDYELLKAPDAPLNELNEWLNLLKNKVIFEAGYMSTTLDCNRVTKSAQSPNILLIIHVPKDKRALYATPQLEGGRTDQLRYEQEVVFPPGQKIRIIGANAEKNNNANSIRKYIIKIRGILL